jgi:hypothetical protein
MNKEEALQDFAKAYDLFIAGNFKEAIPVFKEVLKISPEDKSSMRIIESCEYWIENPPSEGEDHTITTRTDK